VSRFFRAISVLLLAIAGAAAFGLVTSCNITGGGPSGATGGLNLFVTDAPTDEWEQVTVVLKSIGLHRRGSDAWETVWTADAANPAAGTINLVELNGVAEYLENVTLPVGTYNMMRIVIDTDPATMTLIPDGATTPVPAANITVVDPSGRGEIRVDLDPAILVEEGKDANLAIDFDHSAHPLSIVNLDGKIIISLKIRPGPAAPSKDISSPDDRQHHRGGRRPDDLHHQDAGRLDVTFGSNNANTILTTSTPARRELHRPSASSARGRPSSPRT
jgi:hypothetical protein